MDRHRLNGLEIPLAVLAALMSVLMLAQVISRYVFDNPFIFTEEAARLVFMWLVFWGADKTSSIQEIRKYIVGHAINKYQKGINSWKDNSNISFRRSRWGPSHLPTGW